MLYVTDSGIVKSEIISVDGAIFLISCLSEKMEIPFLIIQIINFLLQQLSINSPS